MYLSGGIDICFYCLRISSSGDLVSGSGTGGRCSRLPSSPPSSSLPCPAVFFSFFDQGGSVPFLPEKGAGRGRSDEGARVGVAAADTVPAFTEVA